MSRGEFVNDIVDILAADEQPPDWLIPDLLVQGSMVCLVGESGAGKSFVSYTLALAVASGVAALSGLVPAGEPRRVLYFDDENSRQDRDKYLRRAWLGLKAANRGKEPNLKLLNQNLWPVRAELGDDDWDERAREWVEHIVPHMIVFDTANACFGIEEENDNGKAARHIKKVKTLLRVNEDVVTATAVILKHAKTRTERGQIRTVRGAKIWKDQSDSMLFQVKAGGRPRKDNLSLTRLIPDKIRAYGLQRPIYITPRWVDAERTGLVLEGSYSAGKDHLKAEKDDEDD